MRERLLETLNAQYALDAEKLPVVPLALYFEGNSDEECIAPNQVGYGRPSLAELYAAFRAIEARPNVEGVFVGLHFDWSEAEQDDALWPAGENIHILTTASIEEAETWIDGLASDGLIEGWPYGKHPAAPTPSPGFRVYTVCWD
jgi:hypothetical protein